MRLLTKYFLTIYFAFAAINANAEEVKYMVDVQKSLLGTEIVGKAIDTDIRKAQRAIYYAYKEIERIDSLYNYSEPTSIVYQINHNANKSPYKINSEAYNLIKRAKEYSAIYEGYFDVSLGAITDLWGFSKDEQAKLPDKSAINQLLKSVGSANIELDSANSTVYFRTADLKIDLGGLAKGYAVDRAARILDSMQIRDYIINAGGDLVAKGRNNRNEPWTVGIKHPRIADSVAYSFSAENMCVATSGDYERYIIVAGRRYHHILNPFTGYSENSLQSVTVAYKTTEQATALGKYIFLIGLDKFLSSQLSKDTKYFIIDAAGKEYTNMRE